MNQAKLHHSVPSAQGVKASVDFLAEELQRYGEYLRDAKGLATGTRSGRILIVGRLLRQKFKERAAEIAKLRPDDVRLFLANQLDAHRTPSTASHLAASLRCYFRYRSTCGDRVGALTAVISSPAYWKLAPLPRALGVPVKRFERPMLGFLSRDEVLAVIGAPDGTWVSQRDHVLFLLLYNSGARVSEIIGVKVGEVVLDDGAACVHLHGKGRNRQLRGGPVISDYTGMRFAGFDSPQCDPPQDHDIGLGLTRCGATERESPYSLTINSHDYHMAFMSVAFDLYAYLGLLGNVRQPPLNV